MVILGLFIVLKHIDVLMYIEITEYTLLSQISGCQNEYITQAPFLLDSLEMGMLKSHQTCEKYDISSDRFVDCM